MAHAQRMAKLAELVQSGELDPVKAIFEQPEPHPPQRSIGEVAAERRSKVSDQIPRRDSVDDLMKII